MPAIRASSLLRTQDPQPNRVAGLAARAAGPRWSMHDQATQATRRGAEKTPRTMRPWEREERGRQAVPPPRPANPPPNARLDTVSTVCVVKALAMASVSRARKPALSANARPSKEARSVHARLAAALEPARPNATARMARPALSLIAPPFALLRSALAARSRQRRSATVAVIAAPRPAARVRTANVRAMAVASAREAAPPPRAEQAPIATRRARVCKRWSTV